ncbi:MAG: tetratricopeptide repeat protein [Balneolia bacterium]|nr:tetratricopeptide repeat protein [Balneolia bacterium]
MKLLFTLMAVFFLLIFHAGVSAVHISAGSTETDANAHRLIDQSRDALTSGNLSLALELTVQAEQVFRDFGDEEGTLKALLIKSRANQLGGDASAALYILNTALEEFPESINLSKLYNQLGTLSSERGDLIKAIAYHKTALNYIYRLPDNEQVNLRARNLHNIALAYSSTGELSLSLEYFLEALELARFTDDQELLSYIYNNLGAEYGRQKDFERSLFYLNESLNMAMERDAKLEIYRAQINLGNVYTDAGKYQEALLSYDSALAALAVLSPGAPSAIVVHNQGRTLSLMQRYEEAEEKLMSSLAISRQSGQLTGEYYNFFELGKLYASQNRLPESIYKLELAHERARNLVNADFRRDVALELHNAYAKEQRFGEAYEILLEYSALSDSLNEARWTSELAQAENRLELERQNQINRLLNEKQLQSEKRLRLQYTVIIISGLFILLFFVLLIQMKKSTREKEVMLEKLQIQKESLQELNKSKDKLFAIVSHDLRNALMSMQGLLSLLKSGLITQEELQELVPQLEVSVQENANVMVDLLAWATEQLAGVEIITTSVDIRELVSEVYQSQQFVADTKKITLVSGNLNVPAVKADYNAMLFVL